jgi:hypothetical protein
MRTFVLLILILATQAHGQVPQIINGIIVNDAGESLPYASILVKPSGVRNSSNANGNFSIVVANVSDTIVVSYIGYRTSSIAALHALNLNEGRLVLKEDKQELKEVEVKELRQSPIDLLKEAIAKIPENYPASSLQLEAFYREKTKFEPTHLRRDGIEQKLKNGYKVTEAIFNLFHPAYSGKEAKKNAMLELVKARKVNITKNEDPGVDSLASNSISNNISNQVSPFELFEYDLHHVKKFAFFNSFDDYEFIQSFGGTLDGQPIIRINFDQKDKIKKCLYAGYVLLDANSLAIVEINYHFSKKKIDEAFGMHLFGVGFKQLDDYATIKFTNRGNSWALAYCKFGYLNRIDVDRKLKGKKVDASFEINTSGEILITRVISTTAQPIAEEKRFGKHDKLDKNISTDYDPNFWKGYSTLLIENTE